MGVAGGLKKCLESNYSRLGVACPRHVEELLCGELKRVDGIVYPDGSYRNVIFYYVVNREPKSLGIGASDYIPVKEIERLLPDELAKFISPYYFAKLEAIELPDKKAKIIVYGVDRPQLQITPFWGGWGVI